MNKKYLIAVLLIVASLMVFGCTQAEPEPAPAPEPEPEVAEEVVEEPEPAPPVEEEVGEITAVDEDARAEEGTGLTGAVCKFSSDCTEGLQCFRQRCREKGQVGDECISRSDCVQGLLCTDKVCSN